MKLLNKIKLKLPLFFWADAAVILAIALPWFLKPGYLFFTDNVWGPNINLVWTDSWFIPNLLIKGLSFVFPVDLLEKVFISAILTLILLGGQFLVKTVLELSDKKDGAAVRVQGLIFVLSLFALFNPFVYDRALYGQFSILAAYGCFLFAITYLLRAGAISGFKNLLPAAVFSGIALLFSIHFIFFLLCFYLLFLVGIFLNRQEIINAGNIKKLLLNLFFSALIVLAINANWLAALALQSSPLAGFVRQGITRQDLVAFQTAGQTSFEVFANVAMMSGFWGKEQLRYFDLTTAPGWQRSFIFLMPIIFYGIYLSFRKRCRTERVLSAGLMIIFIAAVILAVGVKVPITRGLTFFLYDNLPLYKGLRESQKWVAVLIPIYLFYLTIGASRLVKTKIIINNLFISGLILGAVIVMLAPALLWGFNRQAVPTPYPDDWHEVNSFLLSHSRQPGVCSNRILFLPWHMYMSFNWSGKIMANPAPTFFSCPVINGNNMEWGGIFDNSQNQDGQKISDWLLVGGLSGAPLVSDPAIQYIVLAKEVDWRNYSWLSYLPYLELVKETKTLIVYEIKY